MTLGGENILIPNPRDIPGFVSGDGAPQVHGVHWRQYVVQRVVNNAEFAASISRLSVSR
jgi:hypothetical protein